MPKFIKNKDGTYTAKIYVGRHPVTGKKCERTRKVRTKAEGKLLEAQLRLDFANGTIQKREQNYTYQEIYDMWIEEYALTVRSSTLLKTERMFRNWILPTFGDMRMNKIRPMLVQKEVSKWKLSSTPTMISYASLVFKYAVRMEVIQKNPVDSISKPRNKNKKKDIVFYDKKTLKIFLDIAKDALPKKAYVFFHLLAFTGMRKGEASALRWIDITSKYINIDKAVGRDETGLYVGPPKNKKSTRRISIDKETYRLIMELKELIKPAKESHFIFSKDGYSIQSLDTTRKWLIKVQDEMDKKRAIPYPRITVHGFRHTHASLLFESGATIKEVQERLGHSDIQTTMNIYTHVTNKALENVADNFANYIANNF